MEAARPTEETGNPPRALVRLGAVALAVGTGVALWLLPGPVQPEGEAKRQPRAPSATPSAARQRPASGPAMPRYRAFLRVSDGPVPDPSGTARTAGVRWFVLGHLIAGPDGCTARWAGVPSARAGAVTGRVAGIAARLRADGRHAWPVFGGPGGPELSAACPDQERLTAAYRQVIDALRPTGIDFEINDPSDPAASRRRSAAIALLQREARDRGRPLRVTFTLPATERGLAQTDLAMLRTARASGVTIDGVDLLVPLRPGGLTRLLTAARSAHRQLAAVLGVTGRALWRRMGLTPVLDSPADLGPLQARRLAVFRARTGLGWLSTGGARPGDETVRVLAGPGPARDDQGESVATVGGTTRVP
ncbi:MAG: hypothetical protein QM207_05340 [Thermobispora sp.]|nr:hypothetical protein [Thermobispora sp.]